MQAAGFEAEFDIGETLFQRAAGGILAGVNKVFTAVFLWRERGHKHIAAATQGVEPGAALQGIQGAGGRYVGAGVK